jgi:hypothetical protein
MVYLLKALFTAGMPSKEGSVKINGFARRILY